MDAFGLELELDRLEAQIDAEVEATTRALWTGSAGVGDAPLLIADATRRMLGQARALPGELGARADRLWRQALAATFAAADPARAILPIDRSEAGFVAAAATRAQIAARLGFADAWALARACAGEPEDDLAMPSPAAPDAGEHLAELEPRMAAVLDDPAPLVARLAAAHQVDPAALTVTVTTARAPIPGRTFVIARGRDVRIRVWWRPGATRRGVVRVLLHELGHALQLAAPPSRAFDEGVAAWMASMLEREAFVTEALGVPAADAARLAAAERRGRAARHGRLYALAAAERDFYRAGGEPPWRDELAWIDPGASATYARAEEVRDQLDARLGAGWPTAGLPAWYVRG